MEETLSSSLRTVRRSRHPRSIVLLPSNDLVQQVHRVAKSLAHHVKLRCEMLYRSMEGKQREWVMAEPVDVLICTPSQLAEALLIESIKLH